MECIQTLVRTLLVLLGIIPEPDILAKMVAESPASEAIENKTMYIVSEKRHAKWAYFRCPADRDEMIQLCLMPNHRPRWMITIDFLGRPTVNPSIRQLDGSFAHFWIRKGQINWCKDSGREV